LSAVLEQISKKLINRNYARLWYGQAISNVGDYVFDTTMTLWVATKLGAGKSWAPAAVSGLLLAAVIAIVFVGPIAGVWVDRWNHKRTMLGTEAVRAALAGIMALISLVPTGDLPIGGWLGLIFVLVFALNSAGQLFTPARLVTIGQVVPDEDDRNRAFGIGNATNAVAGMIGPPLAAPLLFTSGVTWALALNALSYVVSFIAVRGIEVPEAATVVASASVESAAGPALKPRFWADFKEGLHFLTHSKVFSLLLLAMIAQAGTGALNTLDVFFVTENLHVAAKFYGLFSFGIGVGLIIGSLVAAKVVARLGASRTLWITMTATGLVYLLYARQTTFVGGFLLAMLFIIPIAIMNTGIGPLLLALIPQALFGRVMSVFSTFNQGTQMISMVVSGWLASSIMLHFHATPLGIHVGPIDTILTVAGLLIVLAGGYAFFALPRGDLDPAPEPDAIDPAEVE
jgi:predicted MFS family arabinose efflux permease